ncbi:hypothetical protein [Micromonospora humidisoli]|uniref:Uncharacterized protein n=1 Tax=Micromonospora humidisoli TaxID=2807622 RepID=A0ABS2JB55_9ACTN|nr:hypothetical protein [Micromonospora humidisoli]MBM7082983.1 hypothetical protein [Micromonospora humidisoli]
MEFLFDVGFQRFKPNVPTEFTFVVNAEGPFGPAPQLTFDIDLNALRETWIGQTTIGKVVEQLEKGNRNLSELTSAVRQLNPEVAESRRADRKTAIAELEAAE